MDFTYSIFQVTKNVVPDTLLRLKIVPLEGPTQHCLLAQSIFTIDILKDPKYESMEEQKCFYDHQIILTLEKWTPDDTMPVEYSTLIAHQKQDKELQQNLKDKKTYRIKTLHGEGKIWDLIC